jgi:NAD+ synthase (glutamine-hydrolysing)
MDLILKKHFIEKNLNSLNIIKKETNKKIILGFIDSVGNKIFNSAAYISGNDVKYVYHKKKLPNYSVFDEKRWFNSGEKKGLIKINDKKVGLSICEDVWSGEICKSQDADIYINISASPYSNIKIKKIEKVLLQRYNENKKPIFYLNQVGAQDGLVYFGHSMFINDNTIVKKAKDFEEDILLVDVK